MRYDNYFGKEEYRKYQIKGKVAILAISAMLILKVGVHALRRRKSYEKLPRSKCRGIITPPNFSSS